mmetsp:Transcript_4628/g.6825  ORF Transcript_4628/g.6825 Transcript_4628/m.6825 type:complete len:117 (+) Transcript_4628:235-585(+)
MIKQLLKEIVITFLDLEDTVYPIRVSLRKIMVAFNENRDNVDLEKLEKIRMASNFLLLKDNDKYRSNIYYRRIIQKNNLKKLLKIFDVAFPERIHKDMNLYFSKSDWEVVKKELGM